MTDILSTNDSLFTQGDMIITDNEEMSIYIILIRLMIQLIDVL